jgi:thioredoxin-like negative regulator of GroEL
MAILTLNDDNFEKTLSENPVTVVKYYADWCGSCRLIAPKYKRMSEETSGATFAEVNAEHCPTARKAGGVDNLPFFAVFKDGRRVSGVATSNIEAVKQMLESALAS